MNENNLIRLNKFISGAGFAARRKADVLIESGRVTVNSKTVTELGIKINPETDAVKVDGELIKPPSEKKLRFIYILLNKPAGYVTTTSDEKHRPTVLDLVGINQRIYPVGRLDYDTEGLLLLTNDGDLANKFMHPKYGVYKTYLAKLNRPIDEKGLKKLREGVLIKDYKRPSTTLRTAADAKVTVVPKTEGRQIRISIHEGRNRQVRKMLEAVGCYVRKLKRIEYASLDIKGLREGEWRYLSGEEIKKLKEAAKS